MSDNITETFLRKHKIYKADDYIYRMLYVSPRDFTLYHCPDGSWVFSYTSPDNTIIAKKTSLQTKDELITALKFSKLI